MLEKWGRESVNGDLKNGGDLKNHFEPLEGHVYNRLSYILKIWHNYGACLPFTATTSKE